MDLILWRHADAEAAGPDLERALTAAGREQAARVAAWLKPRLPAALTVLASPARRACETAQALGAPYTTAAELGPATTVADVLRLAGRPGAGGTVVLIGHQPTLGRVAAYLLSGREANFKIGNGGAWWFRRLAMGTGAGVVTLIAVAAPELA